MTTKNSVNVDRVSFPVTLSDGQTYTVVGYLYYKGSYHNRTLQVAVHGGNYNHKYWDIPVINGREYSYARYMAEEKYAVIAIDLLGTGESSSPDADFITIQEQALGLHQVLASLRTEAGPVGYAFDKVVVVGHSIGVAAAVMAQATYNDADALVSTGLLHVPIPPGVLDPGVFAALAQYPYFKLPAEVREQLFYSMPGTDPDVFAHDIAVLDDVIARGHAFSILPALADSSVTLVGQVTCPVLIQLGELDVLAPASLAEAEAATWTSASSVTVQTVPGVGHSYNGHLQAEGSWIGIAEWIEATVGR